MTTAKMTKAHLYIMTPDIHDNGDHGESLYGKPER
jgi:hypothetical protein